MKLEPFWLRIAGMHHERNGDLGVVWVAYDDRTGIARVYDAALFKMEVPAVIQYGITARGRHIPMAWRKPDKPMADKLLDAGVNVIPECCDDDEAMVEVNTQELFQRFRAQTLRVERRVKEWQKEYNAMQRDVKSDGAENRWVVPPKGFPLIAATRHAIEMLDWAQSEVDRYKQTPNHPNVHVV